MQTRIQEPSRNMRGASFASRLVAVSLALGGAAYVLMACASAGHHPVGQAEGVPLGKPGERGYTCKLYPEVKPESGARVNISILGDRESWGAEGAAKEGYLCITPKATLSVGISYPLPEYIALTSGKDGASVLIFEGDNGEGKRLGFGSRQDIKLKADVQPGEYTLYALRRSKTDAEGSQATEGLKPMGPMSGTLEVATDCQKQEGDPSCY